MKVLILSAVLKQKEEFLDYKGKMTKKDWPELRTWHLFWIKNLINRGHTVTALNFIEHGVKISDKYDLAILLSGGTNFRYFPKIKKKSIPLFIWWEDSWEHFNRDLNYRDVFIRSKADLGLERDYVPLSWWRAEDFPVVWFPCAVDKDYWYKENLPKKNDIFFSGNGRDKRLLYLDKLARHFKCDFHVFNAHPKYREKYPGFTEQIESKCATFPGYRIGINKARIGIEIAKAGDLGGRPVETMGCGTFCLAERTQGAEHLFREGEEIVLWKDWKELYDKVTYYLKREDERERIAKTAYELVQKTHLWSHRIEYLERLYRKIIEESKINEKD